MRHKRTRVVHLFEDMFAICAGLDGVMHRILCKVSIFEKAVHCVYALYIKVVLSSTQLMCVSEVG